MGTGHVTGVPQGPPSVRVVDGWVDVLLLSDTTEEGQAVVVGHRGQVEPQLIQQVTRPEGIWVGSERSTEALLLQLPGEQDDTGRAVKGDRTEWGCFSPTVPQVDTENHTKHLRPSGLVSNKHPQVGRGRHFLKVTP